MTTCGTAKNDEWTHRLPSVSAQPKRLRHSAPRTMAVKVIVTRITFTTTTLAWALEQPSSWRNATVLHSTYITEPISLARSTHSHVVACGIAKGASKHVGRFAGTLFPQKNKKLRCPETKVPCILPKAATCRFSLLPCDVPSFRF